MISKGGDVVWCARCSRRAAASYCDTIWLCNECYRATHARNQDGVLLHALRGDPMPSGDRRLMDILEFAPDGSLPPRRSGLLPKRRRG